MPGYVGDIDQFVDWVRHIATVGLPRAYDEQLSFGPVMAYIWAALGAIDPALRTAADSSDVAVRIAMKLPATLADFGLAAAVAYGLRAKPTWAIVGAAGVLLIPATGLVSAWWGQYESIFTLAVLVALLLAVRGRDALAVMALTVALLTKPQVAPLLIPFAGWFIARGSLVGLVRIGVIGAATAVVLWLPFVAAGGPLNYLTGLGRFQDDFYAVLSLKAWNLWWIVQELIGHGALVADNQPFAGPLTFRALGYLITGLLLLAVGYGVWRRPTSRTLALGLAAAALVAFSFLTTMHERYGYAAIVFLALLVDDRRVRWLALGAGLVTSLNLISAAAESGYLDPALIASAYVAKAGSIATLAIALALVREVLSGRTPPGTSAGSAAAISAA
jgi:Gpi18-like mannosyltransferase